MCDVKKSRPGAQRDSTYLRKIRKPMIEKKRRERINNCLSELKTLLLESSKHKGAQISKLDKADILELAVKHLKQHQQDQLSVAVSTDEAATNNYISGYRECAVETTRYLQTVQQRDTGLETRLGSHLYHSVSAAVESRDLHTASHPVMLDIPVQHVQSDVSSRHNSYSPLLIPVYGNDYSREGIYDRSFLNGSMNSSFNLSSSSVKTSTPYKREHSPVPEVAPRAPSRDSPVVKPERVWRPW